MRTELAQILANADVTADLPRDIASFVTRTPVVLRTPPNWTAVVFVALLAGLHLANAAISFASGHAAGYVSLLLGLALLAASVACYRFRFEVVILPARKQVRLRHGVGRFSIERHLPFASIRGVRLTVCNAGQGRACESRIELLCPNEDVELPQTDRPREDALCVALLVGSPLVCVSDETMG